MYSKGEQVTQNQREAVEVIIASAIAAVFLVVSLIIIGVVWGYEEPQYPTGTCLEADSWKEIPCGKYR